MTPKYDARRAPALLRTGVRDGDAAFREGQEEAIRHVVEGRGRLRVVDAATRMGVCARGIASDNQEGWPEGR